MQHGAFGFGAFLFDPPWHMFGTPFTVQLQVLVLQHCLEATVMEPEQAPAVLAAEPNFTKPALADVVPQASGPPATAAAPPSSMVKPATNKSVRSKRLTSPRLSLRSSVNIN